MPPLLLHGLSCRMFWKMPENLSVGSPRMQGRRICQYPTPCHFLLNREAYRLVKGVPLDFERWDATWGIILAPFGGLDRERSPRGMPGGSAQRGRSEAEEPAGAKPPRGGGFGLFRKLEASLFSK